VTDTNLRRRAPIQHGVAPWLRLEIVATVFLSTIIAGVSAAPSTTQAQESLVLVPVVGGLDAPVQVTNAGIVGLHYCTWRYEER
jgi:hypothetical protein